MAGRLRQALPSLAKKGPLSEGDMWVLHGLCEEAVFQGVQAQEWVPGSTAASPHLAPLGVAAGGLQGQVQIQVLWDSAKSTQERVMTESRAHAQAGGQTIVVIPAGNMEAGGPKLRGVRHDS